MKNTSLRNKGQPRVDWELEQDIVGFWALGFHIVTDLEKRLFTFLAAHHLTPPQFYVLKTLFEHGGRCRIGQIAREHHLTHATMTGLIGRLEGMQFVLREKSVDDGRSVDVVLTSEGEARFFAVQHNFIEQARAVLRLLDKDERREIMEKVSKYFTMLTAQFPLADPD